MSTPTEPDEYAREDATTYTPLLRTSDQPRWARLRDRLQQEGIEPGDAAIGTLFPDDSKLEFAIVVSRDGRAFSFDFDFLHDPEGNRVTSPTDAWVVHFVELDAERRSTYSRAVGAGVWFLQRES